MLYTKSANSKTASAAPMQLFALYVTTLPAVALPLVDDARVVRNHSSWRAVENNDSAKRAARENV
jgi:hypothetical protein